MASDNRDSETRNTKMKSESDVEIFYKVYQKSEKEISETLIHQYEPTDPRLSKISGVAKQKRPTTDSEQLSIRRFTDESFLWKHQDHDMLAILSPTALEAGSASSMDLSIWNQICEARNDDMEMLKTAHQLQVPSFPQPYMQDSARSYLDAEVFPYLLPALEQMLHKAQEWKCLEVQKCKFNGLDYLAEILWNRNPRYPERTLSWKYIFHIPFVKDWLADHPRPYYPLSWLLTENEAALIIQAAVRGFLVRCQPDVQEMRQFWKSLEAERKEEEQRKREEVQKWHQMLLEEKQQCKAEATAKLQQRQDKAAVKSQNEEMALKEQEEEFDEILMTIYDMTEDSMQD